MSENPKSQDSNPKQLPITKFSNPKPFDLQERTLRFAVDVRDYINILPKTLTNIEFSRQLMRSAGSVGANYIEADDSLGKKDFLLRLRTARKESKESRYWLLLTEPSPDRKSTKDDLVREATELLRILSSIIGKFQIPIDKPQAITNSQAYKFGC